MATSAATRKRVIIPEVDGLGRFRIHAEVTCIGCFCTESRACETLDGPCFWVAVDEDAGVGLCSGCATKPLSELLAESV